MAAPQVQDLQSLIGQYQTALAPESADIDSSIAANDTSGQQQQQALSGQQDAAFKGITQSANDRGAYFSGFTPDAQASYTANTYLPALAQLQGTIASTRAGLLSKKADLNATANTSAIADENSEKSAYQTWQDQQDQIAATAAATDKAQQFTAGQNALDRSATAANTASANAAKNVSPDEAALGIITAGLGGDGYVSPSTFETARKMYVAAGGDAGTFASQYWKYTGVKNSNGSAGKNASNWQSYYNG